jgi:hypothetical protein
MDFYRRRFTNVLLQSAKRLLTRATSLEIAMARSGDLFKPRRVVNGQGN